ncbi:HAD-superfamily phosphatase [Patellaria atrata CBS 101060]|uniref:HAD-superfamily phosphatase n=1 Tax=Patellaria atrata CBS 101060 TaxID=1346257 RepID=A0A9P4S8M9_9PEZI|nr:HAD-superfamily phosphatase [Patellaria atrata CBS 101060]
MNISGTLNVFRLISNPSLCLPHYTVSTFNQIPIPLSKAFAKDGGKGADIRAVILDKDNCFAVPHQNEVYADYKERFKQLREEYPGSRLLIVSNTAGTTSDKGLEEAKLLEKNTGVKVLQHSTKKPGCKDEVLEYFRTAPDVTITSPSQIAVVGDRLFTDVMMANMMGAHALYVKDGVVGQKGVFVKAESALASFLLRRRYVAPNPLSDFE